MNIHRCDWSTGSELMQTYHDQEWGVPAHEDRKLFEYLVLDAFQAGLSWAIVLRKREGFRAAFHGFDPVLVARMGDDELAARVADSSIIRNRAKIEATRTNARAFLAVAEEFGSFDQYFWSS